MRTNTNSILILSTFAALTLAAPYHSPAPPTPIHARSSLSSTMGMTSPPVTDGAASDPWQRRRGEQALYNSQVLARRRDVHNYEYHPRRAVQNYDYSTGGSPPPPPSDSSSDSSSTESSASTAPASRRATFPARAALRYSRADTLHSSDYPFKQRDAIDTSSHSSAQVGSKTLDVALSRRDELPLIRLPAGDMADTSPPDASSHYSTNLGPQASKDVSISLDRRDKDKDVPALVKCSKLLEKRQFNALASPLVAGKPSAPQQGSTSFGSSEHISGSDQRVSGKFGKEDTSPFEASHGSSLTDLLQSNEGDASPTKLLGLKRDDDLGLAVDPTLICDSEEDEEENENDDN